MRNVLLGWYCSVEISSWCWLLLFASRHNVRNLILSNVVAIVILYTWNMSPLPIVFQKCCCHCGTVFIWLWLFAEMLFVRGWWSGVGYQYLHIKMWSVWSNINIDWYPWTYLHSLRQGFYVHSLVCLIERWLNDTAKYSSFFTGKIFLIHCIQYKQI